MARDGFDGLSKMRGKGERPAYTPKPMEGKKADSMQGGDAPGGEHKIVDHGDGTFHTESGGAKEEHPTHLAALAHLGHKITGGDKHHIVHHDGMAAHSHSIHEDGQHEDHGEEDPKDALMKFLGEEGGEEQDHEPMQEDEGPVMGGM
jgi:hypothetical protein